MITAHRPSVCLSVYLSVCLSVCPSLRSFCTFLRPSVPPFLPPDWGQYNVPQQYSKSPKLGSRVCNQRIKYRLLKSSMKSLLRNESMLQLGNVSFQWISDSQLILNMARNEHFYELLELEQQWGHCNVPSKYFQCPKLGNWVSHQRHQCILFEIGHNSLISYERTAQ